MKTITQSVPTYPGGSKSRVNRAGDAVRTNNTTEEDVEVIDDWRAAHRSVLNTFQAILRKRTRGRGISVAQRHKRKRTIFDKLERFPSMLLARMDDVAGCRLIFKSLKQLYQFRSQFHKAKFLHRRRNEVDKYDYIKKPKETGYRGIHDIYEYNVRSPQGRGLAGLNLEIQYRTLIQHSWATAVEVVGFITESQPKFQKGDKRYETAMALASEILARAHERSSGPFPNLSDDDLVQSFLQIDDDIGLMQTLRGVNTANKEVSSNKNSILIFSPDGNLEIRTFRDATDALRELFILEKLNPEKDIVLVRADTKDEVRLAFKNYFSDANDFIRLLDEGCALLAKTKTKRRIIQKKK